VTFAVRVLGVLGPILILTTRGRRVNTVPQGALMVIDDHINLMGGNRWSAPTTTGLAAIS